MRTPTQRSVLDAIKPQLASNSAAVTTSDAALRVLILDDDPIAGELVARNLLKVNCAYQITQVSDVSQMSAALKTEYDTVLLDLHLGPITGLELLEENIHGLPDCPIILLTNDDSPDTQEAALKLGVADFIRKQDATPLLLEKSVRYCSNLFKQYRLREQMSALERALSIDTITGLNTLPYCFHKLTELLTTEPPTAVGVLACQLHNIHGVSRGLGFHRETQILQQYSQWLREQVPSNAVIASTKDNQLLVVLEGFSTQQTTAVGTRLGKQTIAFELGANSPSFSLAHCVGGVANEQLAMTAEKIIQNALTALQAGKIDRTSYQLYSPELHKNIEQRSIVVRDITRALENKTIYFEIQPQFSVSDTALMGGEMLMRWSHPELGMVNPQMVVEVAEATQQISMLGEYALTSTLDKIEHWLAQGWLAQGMRIAVNVSAAELESENYFEAAAQKLAQHAEAAQFLELEITESIKLANPIKVGKTLKELRRFGITIAIDDFGTAHANINQLCFIEANTVKLDKSIVYAADQGERARNIYNSVRKMIHALGTKIVAEGIETIEQLQMARDIGIDVVQGYLLSRPLPINAFEDLLKQHSEQQQQHIARFENEDGQPR